MAEAARLLGRAPTTISRWLRSMADAGFLDRDMESGRYRMGASLVAVAGSANGGTALQRSARRALERLTAATGETTYVGILRGSEAVLIDGVMSPRPVRFAYSVGEVVALHASATGKCLMAWVPESRVRRLLPDRLAAVTRQTETSLENFLVELAATRARGFAIGRCEWEEDLAAAAAPIRDPRGEVVAALSVGGPVSRIDDARLDALGRLAVVHAEAATAELVGPAEAGVLHGSGMSDVEDDG